MSLEFASLIRSCVLYVEMDQKPCQGKHAKRGLRGGGGAQHAGWGKDQRGHQVGKHAEPPLLQLTLHLLAT